MFSMRIIYGITNLKDTKFENKFIVMTISQYINAKPLCHIPENKYIVCQFYSI